jgi:hypothetical protein
MFNPLYPAIPVSWARRSARLLCPHPSRGLELALVPPVAAASHSRRQRAWNPFPVRTRAVSGLEFGSLRPRAAHLLIAFLCRTWQKGISCIGLPPETIHRPQRGHTLAGFVFSSPVSLRFASRKCANSQDFCGRDHRTPCRGLTRLGRRGRIHLRRAE